MQNRSILVGVGLIVVLGGIVGYFATASSEAQRTVTARYEYAVIQGSYRPYPYGDAGTLAAAVNICYLQPAGCANQEVKAEVIISKFAQDERMEAPNNAFSNRLYNRAVQNAYSKAIAKLGIEGWELVDAPSIEFDLYYESGQASKSVIEARESDRHHIWFRREQRQ